MSTILDQIRVGIADKSLRVGPPELKSIRLYCNNKKRFPVQPIHHFMEELRARGPWSLEKKFHDESVPWLKDLVFKKNGQPRITQQALRLNAVELEAVRQCTHIVFTGVITVDSWRETKLTYPTFSTTNAHGDSFEFYYIPWQASADPKLTGLFPSRWVRGG